MSHHAATAFDFACTVADRRQLFSVKQQHLAFVTLLSVAFIGDLSRSSMFHFG